VFRHRHQARSENRAMRCLPLILALWTLNRTSAAQNQLAAPAIFDSDPNHVWNRMYACLMIRRNADGTDYGRTRSTRRYGSGPSTC
jgi:hypothetical protein